MKTTLILRDDLVRRAKARAALRGQPLARYIEEGLEQRLQVDEEQPASVQVWLRALPKVSPVAQRELDRVFQAKDFRPIDLEMWH